jgi:dTMP kinase
VTGRLVAFEGGEGCGKSTQAALLASSLNAVLTAEPGATAVGAQVRGIVLDRGVVGLDAMAEALLMAADRAQHVAEVIRPALLAGRHVVTDRYVGSTLAYQGYGRGLSLHVLADVSAVATDGLEADAVVLLDLPPDIALARARASGAADRFEAETLAFHERVRAGFRALAASDDRWIVVNALGPVDEIAMKVDSAVRAKLGL